jgi:uncharacterized protein
MSEATQEQMEMPKHGTYCWTEIVTNDLEACADFYTQLFGWKISKLQNEDVPMDYREYDTGVGRNVGGMYQMTKEMFGGQEMPPPHFLNYIAVDDVDASVEKVKELGGNVCGEIMDIPKTGRMCIVQDPTGASFALITLKSE